MKRTFALLLIGVFALASSAWADNLGYADNTNNKSSRLVVPSGSELAIRTNEKIDSKSAHVGQTFSATVEQDVVGSSGTVVIPKGSDAQLVLQQASNNELALGVQSVTVNGTRYQVSTSDIREKNRQGIGKNKRTAEMVGGGAVLGTLLGAIAGGGKGAAIGAIAGAVAGGTAQILTKGKEVRVPAETVLRFRLEKDLNLDRAS